MSSDARIVPQNTTCYDTHRDPINYLFVYCTVWRMLLEHPCIDGSPTRARAKVRQVFGGEHM